MDLFGLPGRRRSGLFPLIYGEHFFLPLWYWSKWTEIEAAHALHQINYLIHNLITSISFDHAPKFQCKTRNTLPLEIDDTLIKFLNDTCLTVNDTITYVIDILLRNLIFESLHAQFFKGHFFFGVASHLLSEYLENMMLELITDSRILNYLLNFLV